MKSSRLKNATILIVTLCFAWLAWKHRIISSHASWSGRDSKISRHSYQRITSREAWVKLWRQHTGDLTLGNNFFSLNDVPPVNFNNCMILAVFQGSSENNDGVVLDSSEQIGSFLRVRFKNLYFQTGDGGQKVTPYGIFVLPRSDRTIILQEDICDEVGDPPPKWKERARLK